MSWNKYNLYALATKKIPSIQGRTVYQQKWTAKKETRAYHGDMLRERIFKQAFDPNLRAVTGRLSLRDGDSRSKFTQQNRPLASQTFAGLERRLDIAIFRSLFASSVHQARQMVVHGKVKVNSKVSSQPSYLLKPGDMFHVDPDIVKKSISDYHHTGSKQRSLDQGKDKALETKEASDEITKEENANEKETVETQGIVEEKTAEEETKEAEAEDEIEIKESKSKTGDKSKKSTKVDEFHPKPFMAPFAFIPNYLEVSHLTCSAVYLSHPVAQPGLAEVPSPFPAEVHNLAYSFYIRSRKLRLKK